MVRHLAASVSPARPCPIRTNAFFAWRRIQWKELLRNKSQPKKSGQRNAMVSNRNSGAGLVFPSCSGRERQLDAKRRASANLRSKVYRTVVKLHNSESAGESDAAAAGPRREKQLKNLLPVFRGNSLSGITHSNLR
jgi:hypothetical protein